MDDFPIERLEFIFENSREVKMTFFALEESPASVNKTDRSFLFLILFIGLQTLEFATNKENSMPAPGQVVSA